MSKEELNECLKCFYTSARKKDGTKYKNTSMKSIRAAIDRFLRSPPHNKPFSIISDAVFTGANKVLDAFVKDLRRKGKVAGIVHKKAVSKDQIQRLFESGELGPADSQNPAQLQRTAWFYLTLFSGRRGRENQRQLTPGMLSLRKTPQGVEYFELNRRQAGSLPSTKNHQGGLGDSEDESDAKIFAVAGSQRCPVKTIKNYLDHLNPMSEALFQKPRDDQSQKFRPEDDKVWYCNSPVGLSTLDNMLKKMSSRAGIEPHLTNHCLRATAVTVLSDHNCETRHIKSVTGHRSDQAVESYNDRPSIEQQKKMSHVLSDFVSSGATEASPSTSVSVEDEKENECDGQQDRQAQSEGTVLVQNQFVSRTEVRQSERRSFPQFFFNCNVQVHNHYGGGES